MKLLKLILFLLLIGIHAVYAQSTGSGVGFVNFNTPTSVALGRLQQVPVSLFNGLANINIPLYTIKNKGLIVPISLQYNAGGIKPDDYPTWVGSGFSLSCGGSIVRIVNGLKDEYNQDDFNRGNSVQIKDMWLGNYAASKILDMPNWASQDGFNAFIGEGPFDELRDGEPDEFMINAPGISASFYFVRDKNDNITVKVKSKEGSYLKVEAFFKNNFQVDFYNEKKQQYFLSNSFYEFIVKAPNGILYRFGGAVDAIDFYSSYGNAFGIMPTAWYLTEMVGKTGETVKFNYKRNGNILSYSNLRSSFLATLYGKEGFYNYGKSEGSVSVLHPVYLNSIKASNGMDINFIANKTNDLKYDVDMFILGQLRPKTAVPVGYFNLDSMKNQDYRLKLNEIRINKDLSVRFEYRDTISERLSLSNILLKSVDGIQRYNFKYNSKKLPSYNAKMSDNWGYFNDKNYDKVPNEDLYTYRSANAETMKAGILEEITYPLGGRVVFQYEPHQYGKIATQFPDFKLKDGTGIAGGLRIKKILYYDGQSQEPTDFKEYTYELESKLSSGVLSGIPVYYAIGRSHVQYNYGGWDGLLKWRNKADYVQQFFMYSERSVNMLSNTNGNHVTYSRIIETNKDKSKEIYYYSNHEDFGDLAPLEMYTNMDNLTLLDPFVSRELERGLLKKKILQNAEGKTIKSSVYSYNSSADRYNEYVKTLIKNIHPGVEGTPFIRYVASKIFVFYPFLEKEIETNYNILGEAPVVTEKAYRYYHPYNQIDSVLVFDSQNRKHYVKNKYAFNFDTDVYQKMVGSNRITDVIESEEGINGSYNQIKKTEYLLFDKRPQPSSINVQYRNYDKTDTLLQFAAYDTSGNILTLSHKNKASDSYQWGYNGHFPIVEIKNADNDVSKREDIIFPSTSRIKIDQIASIDFENSVIGDITVILNREPAMARTVEYRLSGPAIKEGNLMFYALTDPISGNWLQAKNAGITDRFTITNAPIGKYTLYVKPGLKGGANDYSPQLSVSYQTKTVSESKLKSKEFYYNGFEESAAGAIKPYAGKGCNIGVFTVPFVKPNAKKYYIDYKYYKNGVWSLVNKVYENNMVLNEGTAYDEVRVYPYGSEISTYTYDPALGMTSKTDGRGITEFYQYDYMQRLKYILDKDGNVLQSFDYHFRTN